MIDGDKRFISGADGAAFAIAMTRTPQGATMFLVEDDNPGFQVGRRTPSTDTVFAGGHCEVVFRDCSVADDAVLGEVGQGFRFAQVRLGPTRLTHCTLAGAGSAVVGHRLSTAPPNASCSGRVWRTWAWRRD